MVATRVAPAAPSVVARPEITPTKRRDEHQQPETAPYVAQPLIESPTDAKGATTAQLTKAVGAVDDMVSRLDNNEAVNPKELDLVDVQLERAKAHVNAAALQGDPRLHAERERGDWRAAVSGDIDHAKNQVARCEDPLIKTYHASIEMAEAIGDTSNAHSAEIVARSGKIRELNELRGRLLVYGNRDQVDFTKPQNEQEEKDFGRIQELLSTARECGVIWPTDECGWKDEASRSARIEGCDRAREELTKDNEIGNLKLQKLAQFFYIHISNAIAALKMLAELIKAIIQRISHG
jgi:hypothetical protein